MPGGEQQRPLCAHREADHERAIGRGRVEHAQRVGGELGLRVGRGLGGPVRAAVAASVERDHPAVPGQVGDLHLPLPGMDDRPGRQEEDGGLAGAVDLVVEPHPVALDVAGLIGVSRPRLFAGGLSHLDIHCPIHSSSSRCPASAPPGRLMMILSRSA